MKMCYLRNYIYIFFVKGYHKGYEQLVFMKKVRNNGYVEKDILAKVRKHNFSIACMLMFYLENQNTTSKNIIPMFQNLMRNDFS